MIKVEKIVAINSFEISCILNNGEIKKIDLLTIINSHSHLKGIEKLKDIDYLKTVKIGVFGEIYWENTIKSGGELWNYDISPEYIFHEGVNVL